MRSSSEIYYRSSIGRALLDAMSAISGCRGKLTDYPVAIDSKYCYCTNGSIARRRDIAAILIGEEWPKPQLNQWYRNHNFNLIEVAPNPRHSGRNTAL